METGGLKHFNNMSYGKLPLKTIHEPKLGCGEQAGGKHQNTVHSKANHKTRFSNTLRNLIL